MAFAEFGVWHMNRICYIAGARNGAVFTGQSGSNTIFLEPVSVPCQVIPSGILQVERPLLEPERADDDRLEALKLFKVRRTSLDRSWEQHCSSLRAAAIRKWHGIICTCLTAFQLGR